MINYLPISVLVARGNIPASTWRRWAATKVVRAEMVNGAWHIHAKDALKAVTLRGNHRCLPSLTR